MGAFKDKTGMRFGRLTVLKRDGHMRDHHIAWLCQCDCGNIIRVGTNSLTSGNTKSCGCYHIDKISGHKMVNIEGNRYGRLVVISFYGYDKGFDRWKCKCDCGNETIVPRHALESGNTTSCGCYKRQRTIETHYKHGGYKDRLYGVWIDIKKRCYNENERSYKDYGGRGIEMCDEWKNDYGNFKSWAISAGYDENAGYMECTIDRIDVNGNYCPENCRWANAVTQGNNRRTNKRIEINGRVKTLAQWAEEYGINTSTVNSRINQMKWDVVKAITTPVAEKKWDAMRKIDPSRRVIHRKEISC